MAKIRENIVGLLRFGLVLVGLVMPYKQPSMPAYEHPDTKGKYDGLIGPTEPLVAGEPLFCPKCHIFVARIGHTEKGTQIVRNNKVLMTVGDNITIGVDGKAVKGFPIRCPNGHVVGVE